VGLEKNERHHVKGRITKMEVIPNLCVSKEVVHENHGGKTWCSHGGALWGVNHNSGHRKEIILACDERGHKTFCVHLCEVVTTPLLEECEDDIYILEMGTWESSETPEISELNCRGQNTSPWGVPHVIGKLLKCKCRKWPCMSHLDICSTSYGKKKGQESN